MNEYIINSPRHPHHQCMGTISETERIDTTGQYIMNLTVCIHGTERCAVMWEELNKITKS